MKLHVDASVSRTRWLMAGFAMSLVLPSFGIVHKYGGIAGVTAYAFLSSLALMLFVGYRTAIAGYAFRLTDRKVKLLTAGTFFLLVIAFVVVYPMANSGVYGRGSDGDEALNLATTELLHGRYPYYPTTYLGNLISPLPGALVLAIPFVVLGNAAYQNLFWLVVFVVAMASYLKDLRSALLLFWVILALSPIVLYTFVIGSDYASNSLYVLLGILWMTTARSRPTPRRWDGVLPAILLGVGLSSRANFLLLLPLVLFARARIAGWGSALRLSLIVCTTVAAVTLPFYVYDPHGFSPLHTYNKLGQFDSVVPRAGIAIPLLTSILGLLLALRPTSKQDPSSWLGKCAIVLAFPVVCGIVLSTIKSGTLEPEFWSFGLFSLFFGAASSWGEIFGGGLVKV